MIRSSNTNASHRPCRNEAGEQSEQDRYDDRTTARQRGTTEEAEAQDDEASRVLWIWPSASYRATLVTEPYLQQTTSATELEGRRANRRSDVTK